MRPEIIVPTIMGCAMLWWIGRGLSAMARLVVAVITLAVVVGIVLFERSA